MRNWLGTHKRITALLLCCLLLCGMLPIRRPVQVKASDDLASSLDSFKKIYADYYDTIVADYQAGYKYVLFGREGFGYSTSIAIILSKTPVFCKKTSEHYYMYDSSGNDAVSGDSAYHSYRPNAPGFMGNVLSYCYASNYDICTPDGTIIFNARNLPDWFNLAYVDAADCSTTIPACNLLSDFYQTDGYCAYYYYKDYPEYAFCVASDKEISVICEDSEGEDARRFIGRVSNNTVASFDDMDAVYIYNRKLGIWSAAGQNFKMRPWMVTFYGDPLIAVDHVYDYRNKYDNFTLLASNKPIKQINFDSSGTLFSETAMTPSGTIGQLPSFPVAPAPDLVETVQEITMTEVMTEVVGLIPLLVGLVISFLGLRKGFRMLSQVLHKA